MPRLDGGAVVLRPEEAPMINQAPVHRRVLATRDVTGGAFSLIETAETEPGDGPPLHIHRDAAESFYVIDGEYLMHIDGRDFRCPAGSFIYVPIGMAHTFRSVAAGSRKLNLYTPSAMEGYFDELSAAVRVGADEAALADIAARYSMEIVGSVPSGYLAKDDAS